MADTPTSWHFRLLVVLATVYLTWRAVELIARVV